jgi:hypothetical protein
MKGVPADCASIVVAARELPQTNHEARRFLYRPLIERMLVGGGGGRGRDRHGPEQIPVGAGSTARGHTDTGTSTALNETALES